MLILEGANAKLQVITGSAGSIRYHSSWMDNNAGAVTPGGHGTTVAIPAAITTPATTDIVAAVGASKQRNVKYLELYNDHASVSNVCTAQITDATRTTPLWKSTLAPNESVILDQTGCWTFYDSNGNPKVALAPVGSPLAFVSATLGTVAAGQLEFDGSLMYVSHFGSERGILGGEQYIKLNADFTLTSQTPAQKMFNSPAGGALTVSGSRAYEFECYFDLTTMSASSGSFGFAFIGTATLTRQKWKADAIKAAIGTSASWVSSVNTAANTALVAANTTTTGAAYIEGTVHINAGGTLIPAVSLGVAAAAIVKTDSWFRIRPLGPSANASVGNWS
jgi:hypothetical protein